jgi:ribose 5-phosphate isomerase RpiB
MDIIIGSDHAGFDLKEGIKRFLSKKGNYIVKDMGAFSDDPVDYPIIAHQVAKNIAENKFRPIR